MMVMNERLTEQTKTMHCNDDDDDEDNDNDENEYRHKERGGLRAINILALHSSPLATPGNNSEILSVVWRNVLGHI